MNKYSVTVVSTLFVLATLAACGGGGGGGGSAATLPPNKAFGTAALIETDNAGDASSPQVAIDTNGNALAVWRQSDGTRYNIWANRYTAGTGWGSKASPALSVSMSAAVPKALLGSDVAAEPPPPPHAASVASTNSVETTVKLYLFIMSFSSKL